MANILYKKLKRQYTDNGVTWIDMNVYKVGEVLEDPSNCQSENTKQCRWVGVDLSEGYTCVDYSKYTLEVEECSTDGIIWTRTGNQREGVLVESNSVDCGYSGNTSGDTGNTGTTTEGNLIFEFSGNYFKYTLNHTVYTATTSPYSTTLQELGINNLTSCSGTFNDMFNDVSTFTNLIEFPDTSNVTEMQNMFTYCSGLTSLDVSNFNTSNVTDMTAMFFRCSGLTSLDVTNFNTSKVTDMTYIFNGCSGLTSLDVTNFNTSNVTRMEGMFGDCRSLTSLNLSNFDTSKVESMTAMFNNCRGLTSLNLSNFNTSNVTDMTQMFSNCRGLTSLNLSNWDTSNTIGVMTTMFYECRNLTTVIVANCNNTTKQSILDELNEWFTATLNGDTITVTH